MIDPSIALDNFAAWQADNRARVTNKIDCLKHAVIPPLRQLGIYSAEVAFDGYGESGTVEGIYCRDAADADIELPELVAIRIPREGHEPAESNLKQALEDLAYAPLELHHPGWENNDGAGGALEIDVAAETFSLDCKLRYTAYDDHYTEL